MRVLVTGPESSGTRWLTDLVAEAGAEALHRSIPEGEDWLDLVAMARRFDAVVAIIRGAKAHLLSLEERIPEIHGEIGAKARRRGALASLAPLLGRTDVHLVTYESMANEVEARFLLTELGLDLEATARVPFNDANLHRFSAEAVPIGYHVEWADDEWGVHRPKLVADA